MRRRRRNMQSSFDLFLDTVCNAFGGVLFIALLIAIQVRQTVEQPPQETCSPERIAELSRRAEKLAREIESTTMLLEIVRTTLPEPVTEYDKNLVATYAELLDTQNMLVAEKTELTRHCLDGHRENAESEQRLKDIENELEKLKAAANQLAQIVRDLRNEHASLVQKTTAMQELVGKLETETTQKMQSLEDKNASDQNSRNEELFLPKMVDSGNRTPRYLVLRYNRLYVFSDRNDFDYQDRNLGYELGTPKKNRGVDASDENAVKRKIKDMLQSAAPATTYIGVFVYGDSVDSFYIVRDILMEAGFRYELLPTPDDQKVTFGGTGSTQVQ